jgi:SpoVK/Ycf46/Vps4 family AAA+-type ATPase
MKRVVNTILQLFDYLPQSSIVIAATNQKDMIDDALLRRFDLAVQLNLPDQNHIQELVKKTLTDSPFSFDNKEKSQQIIADCTGLSYYTIQKTLLTAIKRSLFMQQNKAKKSLKIQTSIWSELIEQERKVLLEVI